MAEIFLLPKKNIITIKVLYFFPDAPLIIQEFAWQFDDVIPEIPRTRKFLKYWERNLDGQIKEVLLSGLKENGSVTRFQSIDEIFSL